MTVALAHREVGTGPPLVILHGLLGSKGNWRSVAGTLGKRRRVFLVDQRNHGESGHADTMTYPEMAADLAAWMDGVDLPTAAVLGHSMGGKIAMTFAERQPERVDALVVADIAPVTYRRDHGDLVAAMRGLDLARMSSRREADAALARAVPDRRLRAFVLHNLARAGTGYAWRVNLGAIEAGMSDLVGFPPAPGEGRYAGPALFLRGEASGYVPDDALEPIRRRFPNASLASIPEAGHWLHAEQPDRFVARVETFLDDAEAP